VRQLPHAGGPLLPELRTTHTLDKEDDVNITALLGLDISPTKVGWGFVIVDLDDIEAYPLSLACGSDRLDYSPENVSRMLNNLRNLIKWEHLPIQPALCYIEANQQLSKSAAFEQGRTVGMFEYALRSWWPGVVLFGVNVQTWRSSVGIETWSEEHGRKHTRTELKKNAITTAAACGFMPSANDDDAAEAALIAMCARRHLIEGKVTIL
jgi:hypothetical protein